MFFCLKARTFFGTRPRQVPMPDGRCLVYADFLLSPCSIGMRNGMCGSVLGERNDVNKQRKNPNP